VANLVESSKYRDWAWKWCGPKYMPSDQTTLESERIRSGRMVSLYRRPCMDPAWGGRFQGMSFYTEYELQEPLPGGKVKSFKARHLKTKREVRVHILVGGNDAVLKLVKSLPPEKRPMILDQGQHEGTVYYVTPPLPEDSGFEQWLGAPVKSSKQAELGRGGRGGGCQRQG